LEIHPYEIEQFKIFIDATPAAETTTAAPFVLGELPARLRDRPYRGILEKALAGLPEHSPAFGAEIVKQCGQLQEFWDRRGNISEPIWYANIGVLAFCEDGDALAHELSSGDDRYTFVETQARLDRQREFGPPTCAHFHALNPGTCKQCPHWEKITSPIVLGQRPGPVSARAQTAAAITRWERTQGGTLKPKSYTNAVMAIRELGIKCRHDVFHDRKIVEGDLAEKSWTGVVRRCLPRRTRADHCALRY